jgi:hypothetical protein
LTFIVSVDGGKTAGLTSARTRSGMARAEPFYLRIIDMATHTHQTAPTQFVEAKGIRFAYRRFGKASGVPLV